MKFTKPGQLLEASRDPRQKRAVLKAIGMAPKKRKSIKMTGSFQGKSNTLGQGGRAAQLKARGVPGGVIGNLARRAQAAPGQKNFHKKVRKEGEPSNIGNEAAKKAKKRKVSNVKIPMAARGGVVPKVKIPTMKGEGPMPKGPMKLKRKKAKKMTIKNSEGDEGPLKKKSK